METEMRLKGRLMLNLAAAAVAAPFVLGLATPATVGDVRAQGLEQLPSVANLVEKLSPAVVDISTTQKVEDSGANVQMPELSPDVPFRDLFEEWLKRQRQGQGGQAPGGPAEPPRTVSSLGAGFVIDPAGTIVTNNHVVEDAESIVVNFSDGTKLKAQLVGRDPKTDGAVLKVKSDKPLPAVKFGDSDKVRVGDWVLAIGNPFGLGGSVSLGIVSARNRDINAGPYDDFLQTDAAIN